MCTPSLRQGILAILLGLAVTAVAPIGVRALNVPASPGVESPVVDQTGTLTQEQTAALAKRINDERTASGNQVGILIIPTLETESLEDYSIKVARAWGIGTKENNNGVLILIAKDDRRLRIEVGTGLEGVLTDVQTGRIIRNDITPLFKQDKYYDGIQAGLNGIIDSIHGEYVAKATAPKSSTGFPWELAFMGGVVGLSWLGSILGRTKSWWAGGVIGGIAGAIIGLVASSLMIGLIGAAVLFIIGLFFDKTVSANYKSHARRGDSPSWWAGGGFLGGGGSSGGFGGGGFGGGGASGSW